MTRRYLHLAVTCVLIAGASGVAAQAPGSAPPPPWGSVVIPGGFAALRQAARIEGGVDEWRTVPLIVELSYAGLDGLRHSTGLNAHAAVLRRLHRQATALSPDRALTLTIRETRRDAVDALLETLGLEFDRSTSAVRVSGDADPALLTLLEKAGLKASDLAARLNAGETVSLATVDSTAPLPLGTAFWESRFEPTPPPHDLLFAILASREMSSLYYGLLSFDDDTLRAVQTDRRLAVALIRRALALPAAADGLRIEGGRVVAPGGAETTAEWERLVGARLDRPAEFVDHLLRIEDGRLAHFYRTMWALSQNETGWFGAGSRASRPDLRRLFEAFNAALGAWRADAMIQPPAFGPADVLFSLATRGDGTLAGPPARAFWQTVFEDQGWPAAPERELARVDPRDRIDPAGLLALVCASGCDRDRLGVVALIQREFPEPSLAVATQLLPVARSRIRYPSLALEIERLRLADPSLYAQLGSMAFRLEQLDDTERAVAVVQYQSAVALLARLRAVGAPAAMVREQAGTLAALPVTRKGFDGGVMRWAGRLFAPGEDERLDAAAARLLAGTAWQPPGPAFEWEGQTYRVDIGATEHRRIRAALEKFSANTLATAASFLRLSDDLPRRVTAEGANGIAAEIEAALNEAVDVTAAWTGRSIQFETFHDLREDVAGGLMRGRGTDARSVARLVESLRAAADLAGADALAALVYALALEDLDGEFALNRHLPRRHHLAPERAGGSRVDSWAIPGELYPEGRTRYITGALLALDAGIPRLAARRLVQGRPVKQPTLGYAVADGLLRNAVLVKPWTVAAEDLTAVVDAYARGLAIRERWSRNGHGEDHVEASGFRGPRAAWLRWSSDRDEALNALTDLAAVASLGELPPASRSSWGAAQPLFVCACLARVEPDWSTAGRTRDADAVVSTLLEPSLRVALELRRRGVPDALAPGVLMLVMADVIDTAVLSHPTDVRAIVAAVAGIPAVRFDDYVAAMTARGPVVHVDTAKERP